MPKLTREQAWTIHRRVARKVAPQLAEELARVSFAINQKENRPFDTDAKNPGSSARGLMQMLSKTQCEVEQKHLRLKQCDLNRIWDAEHAVLLAQTYMMFQYKRYNGDWRKVAHAYNQGSYLPKLKRQFTDGELYANSVFAFYNSTDYAALDRSIGETNVASNRATKNKSYSFTEWA
ncbi:MAG: transglycosylase SLT domain-containing protein [Candidatus Kapabacteria bacterium]|nr:transglycosylase SLT domain-containing protein [Candidatus Kapabacteria bacterium]